MPQAAVGPLIVVVRAPRVKDHLRLGDRGKPMSREALTSQAAIEASQTMLSTGFPGRLKSSTTWFQ
jgi:hypothetical protein